MICDTDKVQMRRYLNLSSGGSGSPRYTSLSVTTRPLSSLVLLSVISYLEGERRRGGGRKRGNWSKRIELIVQPYIQYTFIVMYTSVYWYISLLHVRPHASVNYWLKLLVPGQTCPSPFQSTHFSSNHSTTPLSICVPRFFGNLRTLIKSYS